jgi:tetratricopeptide (TPR) repeat protein
MANGLYDEALDAFRRCMRMIQAGETPRPYPEAMVTYAISVTLLRMGRTDEAEIVRADARKRFVDLGMEAGDEYFRRLDRTRARILHAQGRLEEAIEILETQLQIEAENRPRQQRYNRTFLAYAYLDADRGEEALELLRGAREAYAWPEGHPERYFLNGAIAFAEAATGGDPAEARKVLDTSLAFFDDSGYGGTNMAQDLRGWLARLEQLR